MPCTASCRGSHNVTRVACENDATMHGMQDALVPELPYPPRLQVTAAAREATATGR
jgi:hypothetical protein